MPCRPVARPCCAGLPNWTNLCNLGLAHVAGMVQVMKANAASDSVRISSFGSAAIVQTSESAHATDPAAGLT